MKLTSLVIKDQEALQSGYEFQAGVGCDGRNGYQIAVKISLVSCGNVCLNCFRKTMCS